MQIKGLIESARVAMISLNNCSPVRAIKKVANKAFEFRRGIAMGLLAAISFRAGLNSDVSGVKFPALRFLVPEGGETIYG